MAVSKTHLAVADKYRKITGAANSETLKWTDPQHGDALTCIYYDPAASRTGVILQKGDEDGQVVHVVNNASGAYSITFAAVGTSNVVGGTNVVIGQNQAMSFRWSKALGYWIPQGAALNASITGAKLVTGTGYFTAAINTNGTTPVNVFGATVPFGGTVTSIDVIALDTTAGNITIADTAGTIATIAKSTTAGVVTGATSLANATFSSGNTFTVVSSSAGNATVRIWFTVA